MMENKNKKKIKYKFVVIFIEFTNAKKTWNETQKNVVNNYEIYFECFKTF